MKKQPATVVPIPVNPSKLLRAPPVPAPIALITIEPIAVDVKHSAQFTGMAVGQIRRLIYAHKLKAFYPSGRKPGKHGGREKQLILVEDLRAFMTARTA